MSKVKIGMGAFALACAAVSGQAATLTSIYAISPTTSDRVPTYTTNVWFDTPLDGGGFNNGFPSGTPYQDFLFDTGATLAVYDDATAELSGTVRSTGDATSGFRVTTTFDETFESGNPPTFKDVFGGAVEPANNVFYNITGGAFSGFGDLGGLDFTVMGFTPNGGDLTYAQLGGGLTGDIASNQHNSNLGMSLWFGVTAVTSATCTLCDATTEATLLASQGDIMVDLAPVPAPAAGVLLLTALAGFGMSRRRV